MPLHWGRRLRRCSLPFQGSRSTPLTAAHSTSASHKHCAPRTNSILPLCSISFSRWSAASMCRPISSRTWSASTRCWRVLRSSRAVVEEPTSNAHRAGAGSAFCTEAAVSEQGTGNLWMEWVRALQAISQTGLHYAQNPFDIQRYQEIDRLAAAMLAQHTTLDSAEILTLHAAEFGYATPKVDVRGIVFHDDRILLIREIMDAGRWTVPGGWADVNETPGQAVVREVREESGFETRASKLLAVYDREQQGHVPPFPFHVYKLFFLCELIGGEARPNEEASEIDFFARDALPELSVSRVTERQIQHFFDLRDRPAAATEFD